MVFRGHFVMSWGQVGLSCSCHEAGSGSSVHLALSLTWAGWTEVGAGGSSPEKGRLHFLYPHQGTKGCLLVAISK